MKLHELKSILSTNSDKPLHFVLPDGDVIPSHFHVTEVGHVAKRFVDCGGTFRQANTVQLQIWLGHDQEHRLLAGKFAGILELAKTIIPSDEIDVEVEYEDCSISQYPVGSASAEGHAIEIKLVEKHTDCLAKEACGVESSSGASSGCCGGGGCG